MHLRFPKKRDFWSWNELSCLSKTIGFSEDLFKRNVPKERESNHKDGLSSQNIEELIESKALAGDLHRTFNMHDASYNTKVIQKSMELLSSRLLTFQHIKEARIAFQLYEHMDNAGLVISEHVISRTLKLCGRAISHRKLMQHIKHMDRLIHDRLMFYEFLEILLICEKLPDKKTAGDTLEQQLNGTRDDRNLYPLQDFRDILLTEDEKIAEELNSIYKKSQEKIPLRKSKNSEETGEKRPWKNDPIVNYQFREEMVSRNNWQKKVLNEQIQLSNQEVLVEGTFQSCNCNEANITVNTAMKNNESSQQPIASKEVSKMVEPFVPKTDEGVDLLRYRREQLVTETELDETRFKIEDLLWNIATQGERMRKRQEATSRRQRRTQKSRAYSPVDDSNDKQAARTKQAKTLAKGTAPLASSKDFRRRLRDLSSLEAGEHSELNPVKKGRSKSQHSRKDGLVDKIPLDEKLKQIDLLMERVCQR